VKLIFSLLLLSALIVALVWEHGAIGTARTQNESLRAEQAEAERLEAENQDLPKMRAAASAPAPASHNAELLRLRNEVRQLRSQLPELEKLRAANGSLAEEIKAGKFAPRRMADVEGAVPREKWEFAGFATPETAIQSFFTALASGDPEQFLRCAAPQMEKGMRNELARDPEQFRQEFTKQFSKMANLSGYRIVSRRPKAENPDQLEVGVQVVADGAAIPLQLFRVGNEWKIGD
jgi:hypothetical protein